MKEAETILKAQRSAFQWYQKAARVGNSNAQYMLSKCYFNGIGVERNYIEVIRRYKKEAEAGNAEMQYGLGLCYYYGSGVKRNYAEAMKWYQKAAQAGNVAAQ